MLPGTRAVVFTATHSRAAVADPLGGRRHRGRRRADAAAGAGGPRRRGSRVREAGTILDRDGDEHRLEADLVAVNGGFNPVLGLWRAIGGGLGTTTSAPASSPTARVRRGSRSWARRWAASSRTRSGRWRRVTDRENYVDLQRDQTVADVARGRRRRPAHGRAREASDLHRDRDRPGSDECRDHRRARERPARGRARRAGANERAATVHAGVVLSARRPVPRPHARRRAAHTDPPMARRERRRVRERRPVEASLVLPTRPARRWRHRCSGSARRSALASA